MEGIRDKIAKLLALAESSNEHEAEIALLRARELMAKHKLTQENLHDENIQKVVKVYTEVAYTSRTNYWASELSKTIADNHCCVAIALHTKRKQTEYVGFIGWEDDVEVTKRIFMYAYDCVMSVFKKIKKEKKAQGLSGTEIRNICNSYGYGFCIGLSKKYKEQESAHEEYALTLKVPQEVLEWTSKLKTTDKTGHSGHYSLFYIYKGERDGSNFDMST